MTVAQPDTLTNGIQALFVAVFGIGGALFARWAGPKTTSARWPHSTIVWNLLALGMVCMWLGLAVAVFVGPTASEASVSAPIGSWLAWASSIVFQGGLMLIFASMSWLGFLWIRYPLDSSKPVDRSSAITVESLIVALTIGYAVFVVVNWTSSFPVVVGAAFAAFLLTLIITPFLLGRVPRQRRMRD